MFIQIGCHKGDSSSLDIIKQYNYTKCVFIDCNKRVLLKCEEYFKNSLKDVDLQFICAAITPDKDGYIDIYLPKDKEHEQVTCNIEHLFGHGHINNDITIELVQAISINNLLDIYKPEFLIIDTEGFDIDIINMIDFEKYKIKHLIFEYIHSDGTMSWGGPNLNLLLKKLTKYYNYEKNGYNMECKLI